MAGHPQELIYFMNSENTQTNASPAKLGPLAVLRHHITGAIERGEKEAIAGQPQTVADYSYSRPDYLNSQFPREVSGWHNFNKADQELMKMNQESFLTVQLGYVKNEDGSFTQVKSRALQALLHGFNCKCRYCEESH